MTSSDITSNTSMLPWTFAIEGLLDTSFPIPFTISTILKFTTTRFMPFSVALQERERSRQRSHHAPKDSHREFVTDEHRISAAKKGVTCSSRLRHTCHIR